MPAQSANSIHKAFHWIRAVVDNLLIRAYSVVHCHSPMLSASKESDVHNGTLVRRNVLVDIEQQKCVETYFHTHTPLSRQSLNIAHVIMSTISPHMLYFVRIAPGVTSPHIAKVTTHYFYLFVRKIFQPT